MGSSRRICGGRWGPGSNFEFLVLNFELRLRLKSKIGVLLPAVVFALLMTAGGVRAQAGQGLVVDEQSEESHFPDTVDFRLRAHGFLAVSAGLTCRMAGDGVEKEYPVSIDEPAPNLDLRTSIDLSQD